MGDENAGAAPPPPQVLWFDINMYVCALSYICKYDRLL